MKINKHRIYVQFDSETLECWHYLKSVKVRPTDIMRSATKDALIKKATEMKKPKDTFIYPF